MPFVATRAGVARTRPQIVIAGGGVAALETLLALRHHVGDKLDVTLIAPDGHLALRPLAVVEPFGGAAVRQYPLASIAEDMGARLIGDRVRQVIPEVASVRLAGGDEIDYDELVVAVGAHRIPTATGLTFFGGESVPGFTRLLGALRARTARSVAFVVPAGPTWHLPAYELALQTAASSDTRVELVSAEPGPLAAFGAEVSEAVGALLEEAGVVARFGADAVPEADRLVSIPRLEAARVRGLPRDEDGLLPIDVDGLVEGPFPIYAAGDGTSLPYHQGGIAAQLAGQVAAGIARRAGVKVPYTPFRPVLRAMLVTGARPLYLMAEIEGQDVVRSSWSHECPWGAPAKVAAPFLGTYLAERDATGRYATHALDGPGARIFAA